MNSSNQRRSSLPIQTWMKKPSTVRVIQALTHNGGTARFVGGCVRDTLAGKMELDNVDIDIATPIKPREVIKLLEDQEIKSVPSGLQHGTITAVVDGDAFEITTLRTDLKTDGRHAVVEYTDDWEIDAHRRDFTINSIYCDSEGKLYDPVGGIEDLNKNKIQFIGDPEKRIQEDTLRVLRYFRFKALFDNSDVDPIALAACKKFAPKLEKLSGERICSELLKWLSAHDPIPTLIQSRECGVLDTIFMSATTDTSMAVLKKLLTYEQQCADIDPIRRLYAVCANKADVPNIARRLRLSKSTRKRLENMDFMSIKMMLELTEQRARKIIYVSGQQNFIDGLLTSSASSSEKKPNDLMKLYQLANSWTPPVLPITGEDVLAIGIPRGPLVKRFMSEIDLWWLEGNFQASRTETLDQLASLVKTKT